MASSKPEKSLRTEAERMTTEFCDQHGVSKVDLMRKPGSRFVSALRRRLWMELYETLPLTTTNIAWLFGRDSSAVIRGIAAAREDA